MRFQKILIFFSISVLSTVVNAESVNNESRGLCVIPKYKNKFVSSKEKMFYENSIDRAERCVVHIVSENEIKINELKLKIKNLEKENSDTLLGWRNFKLKSGME